MPQSQQLAAPGALLTAESLFSVASTIVLPGWLLLLFLPRWKFSAALIAGLVIPALLGLLYTWLIIAFMADSEGGFGSLAEIRTFFSSDPLLLAGWVHYLAFDLFVGAWEVRDSQRLGIHHLAVFPCLLLTFMLGPVGLLLYLALRMFWKKRWMLNSA